MKAIKVTGRNRITILEDAWPVIEAERLRREQDDSVKLRTGRSHSRKPPFDQELERYIRTNNMYYAHAIPGDDPNVVEACYFISFTGLHDNYEFVLPPTDNQWFKASHRPAFSDLR
jgi:hypothetical protein